MNYSYNTILDSFGNLSFIQVEFKVGSISYEEEVALHKDIAKTLLDENPSIEKYEDPKCYINPPKFVIFYDEESGAEKIDKLFFKLKLQYPQFEILDGGGKLMSFRS